VTPSGAMRLRWVGGGGGVVARSRIHDGETEGCLGAGEGGRGGRTQGKGKRIKEGKRNSVIGEGEREREVEEWGEGKKDGKDRGKERYVTDCENLKVNAD